MHSRSTKDWTPCQLGQRHEAIAACGEVRKHTLDGSHDTKAIGTTFVQDNNIARSHLFHYSTGHRLRISRVDIKRRNRP